jgi:hypothetical protein
MDDRARRARVTRTHSAGAGPTPRPAERISSTWSGGLTGAGPKMNRRPGRPGPIAPAMAASASGAMRASTRARRAGRRAAPAKAPCRAGRGAASPARTAAARSAGPTAVRGRPVTAGARPGNGLGRRREHGRVPGRSSLVPIQLGESHAEPAERARGPRLDRAGRRSSASAVSASDSRAGSAPITSRSRPGARRIEGVPDARRRGPRLAGTVAPVPAVPSCVPAREVRAPIGRATPVAASLATIRSSQGRNGAPSRKRGSAA